LGVFYIDIYIFLLFQKRMASPKQPNIIMDIESRMARLEERLTWLQEHATEQDKVINSQSVEIKKLTKALLALKNQFSDRAADGDAREMPDERPPHY
jgi:uncharacterized coiled-coil protein SlyX